jgi:hypothetical protein
MSDLLNKASLVVIPSGYKEDTVYSVVPSDGSGDLSFTRASNGTRVNSAGLVEVCPWNVWEGSNNFSATYWDQYQLTPTTGTTTDIYGNSSTVYKLIGSVTNSYSFINRSSNGSANTAFSVYAKPNGYTKIGISNRSTNDWNFVVDLVTKVVSNIYDSASSIVSINVVDAVGDWKRIEVVVSSAVQYNLHPLPSNFNSTNFDNVTLNGTDGVWVMASQVNIGSTAKPYFPTTDRLNVPRLTYQNGGGGCPSLLLEKQSTNLALYSEDFASWTQANITVTANNTTSPDGTQNADKIQASGSGSVSHSVRQFISTTSGAVYALSLYAKKGTTDWIMIRHDNGGTLNYFNLNTGAKGTADASATITSVGNGWYRIVVYHTGTGSNGPEIYIATSDGGNEFTASGQNIYIWGAQYEASSYPTSLINTTSASATRLADACFKTGISSLIGQTEGVVFAEFLNPAKDANARYVSLSDGTGNNRIDIYAVSSTEIGIYAAKAGTAIINTSFNVPANARLKYAIAYKSGQWAWYLNGSQINTSTDINVPAMSAVQITTAADQTAAAGDNPLIQAILFPTRLSNSELASLTTL